jgi:putative intracellular protease/amidase
LFFFNFFWNSVRLCYKVIDLYIFFPMTQKKILMVIANSGFQDHEFGISFQVFHDAWIDVTVAAGKKWECIWVFGLKTVADVDIFLADASKYDMVVFIGGWWAYTQYLHDHFYLKLARNAKKIWAICIAPMLVSESGVFNGKTVTWWDQWWLQQRFVESNGAFWSDDPVVVCGNVVTGNWPDAAEEFAKKCVELINNE